eukprot:PLAT12126.1.p1 GENE.PLAT12126.1~~PLAT12126.1.p1  ORF type:complete len:247 (+),score=79.30 PLAT12126.1:114-854(+)
MEITEELIKAKTGQYDLEFVKRLALPGLRIARIRCVSLCTSLLELDLSSNDLTDLSGLDDLVELRVLNVSSNRLTSLAGVERCAALEKLSVVDNMLTSIAVLQPLAAVRSSGPRRCAAPLTLLPQLQKLKWLFFQDLLHGDDSTRNPVCDHPSYLSTVVRLLPELDTLDGERIALKRSVEKMMMDCMGPEEPPALPELPPWIDEEAGKLDDEPVIAEDVSRVSEDLGALLSDCSRLVGKADRLLKK